MEKRGGAAAPTGCFKCGRPGHWSRDCPSSSSAPNPNPNRSSNYPPKSANTGPQAAGEGPKPPADGPSKAKAGRAPSTRPKLTPELLLSEKGLGYVLKHFPRAFKYHGRGKEVSDLGNLIAMYAQWHSQLIPYYSFDQFIKKVEKVGGSKRVRMCLRDLRERVANGGDPTKLYEPPTENVDPDCEPEMVTEIFDKEAMETFDKELENEIMGDMEEIFPPANQGSDDVESMFNEIYQKATEETEETLQTLKNTLVTGSSLANIDIQGGQGHTSSNMVAASIQVTEAQKARMEANRLKALERAAARRALQAQEAASTAAAANS